MTSSWRTKLVSLGSVAAISTTCLAMMTTPEAAASSSVNGSTATSNLVRVWDCHLDNGADLFKTFSTTGNTCWEGLGWELVVLNKVSKVWSGRWTGYYVTSDGKSHKFTPWKNYSVNNATITKIALQKREP